MTQRPWLAIQGNVPEKSFAVESDPRDKKSLETFGRETVPVTMGHTDVRCKRWMVGLQRTVADACRCHWRDDVGELISAWVNERVGRFNARDI